MNLIFKNLMRIINDYKFSLFSIIFFEILFFYQRIQGVSRSTFQRKIQ